MFSDPNVFPVLVSVHTDPNFALVDTEKIDKKKLKDCKRTVHEERVGRVQFPVLVRSLGAVGCIGRACGRSKYDKNDKNADFDGLWRVEKLLQNRMQN